MMVSDGVSFFLSSRLFSVSCKNGGCRWLKSTVENEDLISGCDVMSSLLRCAGNHKSRDIGTSIDE